MMPYIAAMKQTIVIIGWGSLLWDLDDLAPHVSGQWAHNEGPVLPLEFVRVSPKRLQALSVVIDPGYGVPCQTSYTVSHKTAPLEAVHDLAKRERADPLNIGYVDLPSGESRSKHDRITEGVSAWLKAKGYRSAVWTDLSGNFEETTGRPYSLDRAVSYLSTLTGPSRVEAKRYIDSAPAAVDTPLRRALEEHAWWREIQY